GSSCGVEFDVPTSDSRTQYKRRRISSHWDLGEVQASLPSLASPDYYTEPCLADLAAREILDPGYCGRVPDFIVGKFGYGCVKFLGITDVRKLELDHIVKFNRHEIVVYGDESNKPEVGQGLNKPAEVTLNLKIRPFDSDRERYNAIVKTLMLSLERQGGRFISFDSRNGNWSFLVQHFSRFGLSEDDEEDITMDDFEEVHDPSKINDAEILEENGTAREEIQPTGPMLYHSLPAHLGLDPIKMREMKMLMFPVEDEEDVEDFDDLSHPNLSRSKEHMRRTLLNSSQRMSHISNTPVVRKPPLALLDYNPAGINSDSPGNILMAQQNKGLPVKPIRGEGFKLNLERQTPVSGGHSRNIVDAGLFMGKSFRVGWGPNGVLLHSGAPAGGSTVNRDDIAHQLDIWRTNGLDFNFVEKERTRLYELLSGNIHNALQGVKIDWKRFLGLLMWYHLPPDTPLPVIFQNYQLLLHEGKAPYPLPIYIDEGPVEEALGVTEKSFDLTYYLMLLHANGEGNFGYLKTMFSNFSSTYDPLDYHMIWHQRAVLEAVGVFTSNDLQVLDMGIVSQLLCTGQCHWAIYVVLHMPQCDDYPHFHATVIREILFQYCETWSSDESQHQFIQDLEIPSEWLHEAMAVYFNYYGNMSKALEHFLECAQWQKAHSIFTTSVSHTLFLSGDHSEVWRVATVMEEQKSQIENWELGAGIYISFFLLKSSFQEDNDTINEEDPLGSQISDCEEFLSQLNESLAVLGERLPTDARIAYSKMGEEISEMLLSISSRGESRDAQLRCFDTVLKAPVPEDVCSNHLQDAVSLFTCYLSEMAAQSA
ncbi:Nuclear pore complex protein NUP96, partial [Linum perenne]